MSQMPDFCPNPYFMETTTLISILLQLSLNGSSKMLNIFINSISFTILNYHLPLWIFQKNEVLFLVNLHHFLEHYEARKKWRAYLKWKMRDKSCHFVTFLTPFWEVCKIGLSFNTNICRTVKFWSWKFQYLLISFTGRYVQSFNKIWEGHLTWSNL